MSATLFVVPSVAEALDSVAPPLAPQRRDFAVPRISAKLRLMLISLIAAADEANVIGGNNRLLWQLPADSQRMRVLTDGHALIMGRKTHESIGRVLPNRRNIVVTSQSDRVLPGGEAVGSLDEAIALAKAGGEREAFIFGGERLYRDSLSIADRIYLTRVHANVPGGDAYFPAIPEGEWEVVEETHHSADEKHQYPFTFITYDRKH